MKTKIVFLIPVVLGFFFNLDVLGLTGNILVKLLLLSFLAYLLFKKNIDPFIYNNDAENQDVKEEAEETVSKKADLSIDLKVNDFSLKSLINNQDLELNSYLVSQF